MIMLAIVNRSWPGMTLIFILVTQRHYVGISSGLSAGQSDYITQQSVGILDSEPPNLSEILYGNPVLTQSLAGAGDVCDWDEDLGESSSNKRNRSEEEVETFNPKHKHTQMSSEFPSASGASVVSPSYTHCGFRDTEYWQGMSTQTPPIQSRNLNENKNPTKIFVPESPDHIETSLINNELILCESASTFTNSVQLDNVSNAQIMQETETSNKIMHSQKQINLNSLNKTGQNYMNTNVSTNDMSTRPKTTNMSNKALWENQMS